MRQDVPEPWASAMVKAGITDPRNAERASWQELRRRTGIHPSTLSAMAAGERATKQENIDKVAEAIRVDPRTVAEWVGRARSQTRPYQPPAEANLLDREEQAAIDRLIQLMVRDRMGGQSDAGQAEAQKSSQRGNVSQFPGANTLPDNLEELAADAQEQALDVDRNPGLKRQAEAGEEDQDEGSDD